MQRAQHPTDIKFENREILPSRFRIRKILFVIVVVILGIAFFFCGNYLVARMQIISFMQQPPLTDCTKMRSHYDEDSLESLAF